jgi:hypothetical protein
MKLFKILFLSLIVIFTSCSKEPKNHKIEYEVTFSQTPDFGYTNWMELSVAPYYTSQDPIITYEMAKTGHWDYEYLQLNDGDKVSFSLWTAEGYYFEMRIFVDGTQVSYKKMFGSQVLEESGWNDSKSDAFIEFTYHE